MTTISPINQNLIKNNVQSHNLNSTPNSTSVQAPAPQIKPESVELSTKKITGFINKLKTNKKALIAAGVGLLAVTGAIIYNIKKGKTPQLTEDVNTIIDNGNKIIQESEGIVSRGNEILEESQKQVNEVMELLKQGREKGFQDVTDESGKVIRKFSEGLMEELDGDKILRQTEFDPESLKIFKISKNCEALPDGGKKYSEVFDFIDNKISEYTKDCEKLADGSEKWGEVFGFEDNKISWYTKDCEKLADGGKKYSEVFGFEDNKISEYTKDYAELADESIKWGEVFDFKDGKISGYTKDYVELADGSEKCGEAFDFKDGKWVKKRK